MLSSVSVIGLGKLGRAHGRLASLRRGFTVHGRGSQSTKSWTP